MSTEAAAQPRVTLHWLDKSRSQRIMWLLEECKINYEVKVYKRMKNLLAPPELKQVHPLGKSPLVTVLVPGEEKPIVLAESGLIFEYLIEHFAKHLQPEQWKPGQEGKVGGETESWLRYRYLMHFAEGTLMPFMVLQLITKQIRNAPIPFFIKPITNQVAKQIESFVLPNIQQNFELLEGMLNSAPDGGKYLCGSKVTGADILMSFPIVALNTQPLFDKTKFPKLSEYAYRLEKEPNYVAGVKKIEEISGQKYEITS